MVQNLTSLIQSLLFRIPPSAAVTSNLGPFGASPGPPLTSTVNCLESDHDSVHSPATALLQEKTTANSRALVAVPAMDVEALAIVPLRKSKRSELVQRRIRRPFSVSEVEALVQAVEKLGTGRSALILSHHIDLITCMFLTSVIGLSLTQMARCQTQGF